MEMRIVVAASVGAAMLAVCVWLLLRSMRERRKFRLRQAGRGKSVTVVPAE